MAYKVKGEKREKSVTACSVKIVTDAGKSIYIRLAALTSSVKIFKSSPILP